MRTTIDLPVSIRQKLIAEAASRRLKGFSQLIVEALEQYFKSGKTARKDVLKNLRGSLSEKEYAKDTQRIKESRENWRI